MEILIKVLEEQTLNNSQIGIIVSAVLALLGGLVLALKKLGWDKEAKKVEDVVEVVKKAESIVEKAEDIIKNSTKDNQKNPE